MLRSETSKRRWQTALIAPFRRLLVLSAVSLLFGLQVMIWPSESLADLVAVGEGSTPSHRLGVALSALVTLASGNESVNLNILASNDQGGDHLQAVLDRIANFALLDADQLGQTGMSADRLAVIRAVAVIQNAEGDATVLVTHEEEKERRVQAVIEAIFDNLDKLAVLLTATAIYDPTPALNDFNLELHPVADRFYQEAEGEGLVTGEGSDDSAASVDTAAEPSVRSTAELEIGLKVLTLERDALVDELKNPPDATAVSGRAVERRPAEP